MAWSLLAACSSSGAENPGSDGAAASGGTTGSGGVSSSGGAPATGGASGSGGKQGTGGMTGSGGSVGTGGASSGGTGTGGTASGGRGTATGGSSTGGVGTGGTAGTPASGGLTGHGGQGVPGGAAGGGLAGAAGGGASGTPGPCDIFQAGNTPCVAAHSTVRALYASYSGNLYQVRRASDKTTKDIATTAPGGYAASSAQDSFCTGTTCTISVIYDQSPNANHLTKATPGGWLNNGGLEANATAARITLAGHTVYGVYTTSNFDNDVGAVGYRNNAAKNIPKGDEPESMYMVASGKHFNQYCCFDYGNAETNNKDDGAATMEAVYFGNSTQWGRGSGTGPWVMADLEDGVFGGGSFAAPATNTSLMASYVTVKLNGPSGNRFVLKGGDAQSGMLATKYDGARPSGYSPMKKQGALILGVGGDNSHTGEGTFFEGCLTAGVPTDATDDAVQANIVAAGYGR